MLKPYKYNKKIECGVDEVGRGCLAGPVVAAAVILPSDFQNDILNDSKKLTDKKREILYPCSCKRLSNRTIWNSCFHESI